MEEVWKQCPILKGYEVSSLGNIRHSVNKKIRKLQKNKKGIVGVPIWDKEENKVKRYTVSRLVAMTFIPNPDNLPYVLHKDGDKENNRADNLEWATPEENVLHNIKDLEKQRKLSNEQIRDIQEAYIPYVYGGGKGSAKCLAQEYGVDITTIYAVLHNDRSYTNIQTSRPSLTKEDMAHIVEQYTPHNVKSLMAKYGMTPHTFYKWVLPNMGLTVEELKERYYIGIINAVEPRIRHGEQYKYVLPDYDISYRCYRDKLAKYGYIE